MIERNGGQDLDAGEIGGNISERPRQSFEKRAVG